MNLFVANSTMPDHMNDSRALMIDLTNQVREAYSNIRHFDHSGWGSGERIGIGIHPNSSSLNGFHISKDYKGVKFVASRSLWVTKAEGDALKERFPLSSHDVSRNPNPNRKDCRLHLECIITRENMNEVIPYVVKALECDGFTLKLNA